VQNVDVAALLDARVLNAGFIVVRPSPLSRQLYQNIRTLTSSRRIDDQRALNKAVRIMKRRRKHKEGVLRVNVLDRNQFLSGVNYFEKSGRKFPKLLDVCKPLNKSKCPLVVHNNWIVGKRAKIYRFREHLMWLYDGDDQYYSSETRKYLTYTNAKPTTFSSLSHKNVTEHELAALRTALAIGHLLNRVVILPRFHCRNRECPLNSVIHIKTFDAHLSSCYRESSFLQHPKVPNSVKQGVTYQHIMNINQTFNGPVSSAEITLLFGKVSANVLNLGNLQRIKADLDDRSIDREFNSKLQTAFRRARYRQVR